MKEKFRKRIDFIGNINLARLLICFEFSLMLAWLLYDRISPTIFNAIYSDGGILSKLGTLFLIALFFTCSMYVLVSLIARGWKIIRKNTQSHIEEENRSTTTPFFESSKTVIILIVVGLSILLSFLMFGENLNAQWWIIDDHEIIFYLGEDGELDIKEIPLRLMRDTEVGTFGMNPRFRPIYYFLRLLESALWGNRPGLFYLFRIAICAFLVFTLWYCTKDILGIFGSFIFAMAVMSFQYWADIFSRLGPSESYAVLGVSLFCLGFTRYWKNEGRKNALLTWFLIFVGVVIAVGSKENMVLVILFVVWMFVDAAIKKRLTHSQIIFSVLSLLFSIFIVGVILLGIINNQNRNIYATDVSISTIFTILKNELRTFPFSLIKYYSNTIVIMIISLSVVISGLAIRFGFQNRGKMIEKRAVRKIILECIAYLLVVYILFLSQRVFYTQRWPTEIRYDFPGRLGEVATLVILIYTCLQLFKKIGISQFDQVFFRAGYVALFAIVIFQNNYFSAARAYTQDNVRRTVQFAQQIEYIKHETLDFPEYPIIFESHDVMDHEPIFSVKIFLSAYGVRNPISIRMHGYSSQSMDIDPSVKGLAENMERVSKEGGINGFVALDALKDQAGNCYSIDFSAPSVTDCINLGQIW